MAFSCGLPVVATRVGGIPEVANDEKLAILVKPKDPSDLAQALIKGLTKAWDRNYISDYSSRFLWEDNVKRLHQAMEGSLNKR